MHGTLGSAQCHTAILSTYAHGVCEEPGEERVAQKRQMNGPCFIIVYATTYHCRVLLQELCIKKESTGWSYKGTGWVDLIG